MSVSTCNSGKPPVGVNAFRTTREAEMAAYDALPKRLRQALADSPFQWSAVQARQALRRYRAQYKVLDLLRANEAEVRAALEASHGE